MAVLSFDTSSVNCAVHLKREDGVCHERSDAIGHGHAEYLIGMIDEALAALGLEYGDLTRIGVTVGPGSFTGVRVGLSAARGLSLALDIPVAGVSVLRALCEDHLSETARLVVLDAGRGEFYAELFAPDGSSCGGPLLYKADDPFPASWSRYRSLSLIGSGARHILDRLEGAAVLGEAAAPSIATVARLCAMERIMNAKPKPLYLRPPDAKPQSADARLARIPS